MTLIAFGERKNKFKGSVAPTVKLFYLYNSVTQDSQEGKTIFFFSLSDEDVILGCFEKYFSNGNWGVTVFPPPFYKSNSLKRQEPCNSIMDLSASVCLL